MISMQSNLTSFVEIKILYFIIYLVNDRQSQVDDLEKGIDIVSRDERYVL